MDKEKPTIDVSDTQDAGCAPPARKRIGELLVEAGMIESEQVVEALTVQKEKGGKTVEILISLGYLDIDSFAKFMASQPGVAGIDLSRYDVSKEICDLIPREFAEEHQVFPLDRMGKLLTVGMVFPLDSETIAELGTKTGLKVKALLCSPDDIKSAISRYYRKPGEERLEFEKNTVEYRHVAQNVAASTRLQIISSLIKQIDVLPALPQTFHKVQEAVEDPGVSLDEVADAIGVDPLISAKLLQLVNSAAFGLPAPVDNTRMGVRLLGLKQTSMAVLSSSVINMVEQSEDFDYAAFLREALFSASVAKTIAARRKGASKSGIFCAALMHDIGRFAFSQAAPARYKKIDSRLTGETLIQLEQREFGIAHPEAGHILASHWGLPEDIAEPIRFHHTPHLAPTLQEDVAIVALSAYMGEVYADGLEADENLLMPLEGTLRLLNLDAETAVEIYSKAVESITAQG